MFRPVHGDEHRQLEIRIVEVWFGNGDAAMGNIGRINIGQGLDMLDRLVGGDVPEIAMRAALDLVDRRLRPHFGKGLAPQILAVQFRAADIPRVGFGIRHRRIALVPGLERFVRCRGRGQIAEVDLRNGRHNSLLPLLVVAIGCVSKLAQSAAIDSNVNVFSANGVYREIIFR